MTNEFCAQLKWFYFRTTNAVEKRRVGDKWSEVMSIYERSIFKYQAAKFHNHSAFSHFLRDSFISRIRNFLVWNGTFFLKRICVFIRTLSHDVTIFIYWICARLPFDATPHEQNITLRHSGRLSNFSGANKGTHVLYFRKIIQRFAFRTHFSMLLSIAYRRECDEKTWKTFLFLFIEIYFQFLNRPCLGSSIAKQALL